MSSLKIFTNGIIKENPTFRLVLGMCPTLAVTTMASNAVGMGIAATIVLVFSNMAISLLRRFIPDKVRIPAFITIIACFVTVVQLLVKAFAPAVDEALGIYLPLITVNCIILARAEMFACKNNVFASALDGLGMGIGFTAAMLLVGCLRELLGAGTIFGMTVTAGSIEPMLIMILPPGGFFVFGVVIAIVNRITKEDGSPKGCAACGAREFCEASKADVQSEKGVDVQ